MNQTVEAIPKPRNERNTDRNLSVSRMRGREFFYFDAEFRLVSTNDVSEIYLDLLTEEFLEKLMHIVLTIPDEYREQLSDGARKILGL